ncbi:MAG TPA: DUF192 domain-containing protein [Mesorhizobium sp.]
MTHRKWLPTGGFAVALAFAVFAFLQIAQSFADGQAMILPVDPAPLVAVTDSGKHSFDIEIADDAAERSAGLMYRENMADDHGMLFVFGVPQQVAFWMKNTPMPLDLLFIDEDGKVRAIRQGEPQSEAVIAPGETVRFVLELKSGTAARDGIKEGDIVKHPIIGGQGDDQGMDDAPADGKASGGSGG